MNNIRDRERDENAGIRTTPVRIGLNRSMHLLWVLLIVGYLFPLVLIASGRLTPYAGLYLFSFPPAFSITRRFSESVAGGMEDIDKKYAGLFSLYAVLLISGLLLGGTDI